MSRPAPRSKKESSGRSGWAKRRKERVFLSEDQELAKTVQNKESLRANDTTRSCLLLMVFVAHVCNGMAMFLDGPLYCMSVLFCMSKTSGRQPGGSISPRGRLSQQQSGVSAAKSGAHRAQVPSQRVGASKVKVTEFVIRGRSKGWKLQRGGSLKVAKVHMVQILGSCSFH